MLDRPQRLAGLPNEFVGRETLMGDDETLDLEDVLGDEKAMAAAATTSVHDAMERTPCADAHVLADAAMLSRAGIEL